MNGILLLDLALITITIMLLLIVPLYVERNRLLVWQGKMKRAALRHCVQGNSAYGQARYCAMRGMK